MTTENHIFVKQDLTIYKDETGWHLRTTQLFGMPPEEPAVTTRLDLILEETETDEAGERLTFNIVGGKISVRPPRK